MSIMTVIHQFEGMAGRHPRRNAIFAEGRHHTYSELLGCVRAIKTQLAETGFADEARIGVLTGDDVHTYASILAILANGSAYVPINDKNPRDRNADIVADAGLNAILASRKHPAIEGLSGPTVVPTAELDAADGPLDIPDLEPQDLAYLFFTSGSTGRPKGVPIHHGNLNCFLDSMLDRKLYDFNERDGFLQMFELTFDLSVMTFFTPLCLGACCYVVPDTGVLYLNIVRMLESQNITVALMVPSVLAYLSRFFDEIRASGVRYSLFCGEALPQKLVEGWAPCVPNALIQNVYGPTEATIYCLIYDWERKAAEKEAVNGVVAIGTPMPRMEAYVVDDSGAIAGPGARGELCLAGDQVTDRYWEDPDKTARAFVDLPGLKKRAYRTGDVCFVNENGNFAYCGRTDFQVKIDGHRIELGEIEHHAREFTGQSLAAAVAIPTAEGNFALHLFVQQCGSALDGLSVHLKTKLPHYMLPRHVHSIEKMPLNRNGKIDRNALCRRVK